MKQLMYSLTIRNTKFYERGEGSILYMKIISVSPDENIKKKILHLLIR